MWTERCNYFQIIKVSHQYLLISRLHMRIGTPVQRTQAVEWTIGTLDLFGVHPISFLPNRISLNLNFLPLDSNIYIRVAEPSICYTTSTKIASTIIVVVMSPMTITLWVDAILAFVLFKRATLTHALIKVVERLFSYALGTRKLNLNWKFPPPITCDNIAAYFLR